ncbi:hypothetical protein [Aliarcobacter butzleri]|uniref:hypothetical protein n=1 Tax=Aliarcobacter butzleri TaxID=28197 RepID=UPI00125EAC3D|nr:hypothetical protein [Aliarcobacter butzleri]
MNTDKKNNAMSAILNKAKDTSNKSYEAEDKKAEVVKLNPVEKKIPAKAGRKKVSDKKKPRQVYFNDSEYEILETIAERELVDTKTLMTKAIKKYILDTQNKTLEDLVKENEEE